MEPGDKSIAIKITETTVIAQSVNNKRERKFEKVKRMRLDEIRFNGTFSVRCVSDAITADAILNN